jgi:hypothetical protein
MEEIMNRLRILLVGAALITGGSALASAQVVQLNVAFGDRDHNRDRDRDQDRDTDRNRGFYSNHDRDDRQVYTRNRDYDRRFDYDNRRWDGRRWLYWNGYEWVY